MKNMIFFLVQRQLLRVMKNKIIIILLEPTVILLTKHSLFSFFFFLINEDKRPFLQIFPDRDLRQARKKKHENLFLFTALHRSSCQEYIAR
jgi:hypothetical protein